ncbi:MAG: hypothetical protein ACP5FK_07615 [bacterium]
MNKENSRVTSIKVDTLTLIAISIIVFTVQNVLHEFGGHGIATIILGGEIISWSTAYLENDLDAVSNIGKQIVSAAGPLINILFGLLFWVILHFKKKTASSIDFFVWLFMTVNLLTGTGYFLFSGVTGIGDWNNVISYFNHYWLWRSGLIILGLISYLVVIWIALNTLNGYIGTSDSRNKLALKLTLIPYLSGSIASTIGAIFNPISMVFVFTSAASSFGGASGLAWMSQMYSTKLFPEKDYKAIVIKRNYFWIILAIVFLLIHVIIIGQSIKFK